MASVFAFTAAVLSLANIVATQSTCANPNGNPNPVPPTGSNCASGTSVDTTSSCGNSYTVTCGSDTTGANIGGFISTADTSACIRACDANTNCVAASWLYNPDGSQCYLKSTFLGLQAQPQGSTVIALVLNRRAGAPGDTGGAGGGPSDGDPNATWGPPGTCPGADNLIFTSAGGFNYRIRCGYDTNGQPSNAYQGSNFQEAPNSYTQCMASCDATAACQAFTWVGAATSTGNGAGNCYFKTNNADGSVPGTQGTGTRNIAVFKVGRANPNTSTTRTTTTTTTGQTTSTTTTTTTSPTTTTTSTTSTTTSTTSTTTTTSPTTTTTTTTTGEDTTTSSSTDTTATGDVSTDTTANGGEATSSPSTDTDSTTSSSTSSPDTATSVTESGSSDQVTTDTSSAASSTSTAVLIRAETAICPDNDQQNVFDNCGVRYILGCSLDTYSDATSSVLASNFHDCFQACSSGANGACSAFSYSITDGRCYFKSEGGIKFGTVSRTDLVSGIQLEFFANANPAPQQVNRVCTPLSSTVVINTSTSLTVSDGATSTAIISETSTSVIADPSPSGNVNPEGICGGETNFNCFGAPNGNCCGPYGYCGAGPDYCGTGCQAAFGLCDVVGPSSSTDIVGTSTALISSDGTTSTSLTEISSTATVPQPTYGPPSNCPQVDGQTITDPFGVNYNVRCNIDTTGASANVYQNSFTQETRASYTECFEACDRAAVCDGFTWLGRDGASNGAGVGNCYFKTSAGAPLGYQNPAQGLISLVKQIRGDTIHYSSTSRPPFVSTSTSSALVVDSSSSRSTASSVVSPTSSIPPIIQSSTSLMVMDSTTSTTVVPVTSSSPGEQSSTVLIVSSGVTSTTVLPIISSSVSDGDSTTLVTSDVTTSTMVMPPDTVSYGGSTSISLTVSDGITSSLEIIVPTNGPGPASSTIEIISDLSTFTSVAPISSWEVTTPSSLPGGTTSNPVNSFTYSTGITYSLTRPSTTATEAPATSYPPAPACPEASAICASPDQASFAQTTCSSDSGQTYSVNCGVAYVGEEVDESDVVLPPQKRFTFTAPSFGYCQQTCDLTPTCQALNYIGDQCTLFSQVTGYQYVPAAITAEQAPNPPPQDVSSSATTSPTSSVSIPTINPSPTPSSNVNPNGICGGLTDFNCYGAPSGSCCGPYGYCGTGPDYCGAGCQFGFGECDAAASSSASSFLSSASSIQSDISSTGTPSPAPSPNFNPNGICGYNNGFNCFGAPSGSCCSSSGYCGSGPAYCGAGCQPGFGTCDQVSSASSIPTIPTSLSSGVVPITVTPIPSPSSSDVPITDAGPEGSSPGTSTLDFSIPFGSDTVTPTGPGQNSITSLPSGGGSGGGGGSPSSPTSQAPVPTSSLCPSYNDANFTAYSGGTYGVECDTSLRGTRLPVNARRQATDTDAAACMATCDASDVCAGINVRATGCEYFSDISGEEASQGTVALRKVARPAAPGSVITVTQTVCSTQRTTTIQTTQTVTTCPVGGWSCPAPAATAMRMMRKNSR